MSRIQLLLLCLFGALLAFPPGIAHAQNPPARPMQLVKYTGTSADSCLQTARKPTDVQNRLGPAPCMKMGGLQMFAFQPVLGGGYRIINTETGGCLDLEWGNNWSGGRVLDWPCNNQDNQRWDVMYFASWVKIRGWQSKLCVDFANGIAVQTDCGGWGIESFNKGPVWHAHKQVLRKPYDQFGLRSTQSNYCMTTDDAPVLGRCQGPTPNDLEIEELDSAAMTFQFRKDPWFCLVDSGTYAMYGSCAAKAAWRLVQVSPPWGTVPAGLNASRWQVQNVATGRCLTDSTSILLMGACNGTAATTWAPINTAR